MEHGTYIGTEFLCSLGFDAIGRNVFPNRNFSCDSNGLTRPAGPDLVFNPLGGAMVLPIFTRWKSTSKLPDASFYKAGK